LATIERNLVYITFPTVKTVAYGGDFLLVLKKIHSIGCFTNNIYDFCILDKKIELIRIGFSADLKINSEFEGSEQ